LPYPPIFGDYGAVRDKPQASAEAEKDGR
jgi:hypothetical protein